MIPDKNTFNRTIYDYYKKNKRDLPWRATTDPYKILISEIMLQQTQVARVLTKYGKFVAAFADFTALRAAPTKNVLRVWQGMGYNRRALYLKKIAELVTTQYGGDLPEDPEVLKTFPGIGSNTAASVAAFAFNKPVVFIETNIRTVFTKIFFDKREKVRDKEILSLVGTYLDGENPRDWYNALMDYGAMLKAENESINLKSVHYVKQKPFKGSNRELRGRILKIVTEKSGMGLYEIASILDATDEKVLIAAEQLSDEGFFTICEGKIIIAGTRSVHDQDKR